MRQVRNDGPAAFLDGVPERMLSRHASDDLRQRVRDLCVDRAETILAATRALAHRPDRRPLLPTIDCPTLLVCGGEDTTSPAPEMRSLAAADPRRRVSSRSPARDTCRTWRRPIASTRPWRASSPRTIF